MISKYHNENVGEVFGEFTLIDGTLGYEADFHRKNFMWKMRCSCGAIANHWASRVVAGTSKRCIKCASRYRPSGEGTIAAAIKKLEYKGYKVEKLE